MTYQPIIKKQIIEDLRDVSIDQAIQVFQRYLDGKEHEGARFNIHAEAYLIVLCAKKNWTLSNIEDDLHVLCFSNEPFEDHLWIGVREDGDIVVKRETDLDKFSEEQQFDILQHYKRHLCSKEHVIINLKDLVNIIESLEKIKEHTIKP